MTSKRENSPGPAGSKLGLGKLTSRQNPTGSISIRFNAASTYDDLDDDDLTITGSSPKPSSFFTEEKKSADKVNDKNGKEAVKIEHRGTSDTPPAKDSASSCKPSSGQQRNVQHPNSITVVPSERSKSAPPSEMGTPLSADPPPVPPLLPSPITEKLFWKASPLVSPSEDSEQRSLLAGFRERFQDRIPEPLSNLFDKFSKEDNPEEKERKLKKSESLDSARSDFFNIEKIKKELLEHTKNIKGHSRSASTASIDSNSSSKNEPFDSIKTDRPSSSKHTRQISDSFDIVEDFYEAEPLEDFTGNINIPSPRKSTSSEQISKANTSKTKTKLQKFLGSLEKGNTLPKSVSMTLSGLLSNKEEEPENIEEFYDLEDSGNYSSQIQNVELQKEEEQIDGPGAGEDKGIKEHDHSFHSALAFQKYWHIVVLLCAYLIIPMPDFTHGLFIGIVCTYIAMKIYQWWTQPPILKPSIKILPLDRLPPLQVPEIKPPKNDEDKFKVWMNELYQYNPDDYHISQTHSVYVQLEASNLRLQRPKVNIAKRGMWDEKIIPNPTFIHQRHFDLIGSHVSLVPPGLVKKRIWSKKYPICVVLAKTGSKIEHRFAKEGSTESDPGLGFEVISPEVTDCDDSVLFLFARTGREKETWFRRLVAAARGDPLPRSIMKLLSIPLPNPASPDRASPEVEIGIDVAAKYSKRHSTPGLVRQVTPPLSSSPPSTESITELITTSTSSSFKSTSITPSINERRQDSAESLPSVFLGCEREDSHVPPPLPAPSEVLLTQYIHYMGHIMPSERKDEPESPTSKIPTTPTSSPNAKSTSPTKENTDKIKPKKEKDKESELVSLEGRRASCDEGVLWLNAVLGRCIWDFLREQPWAHRLQERIQRKLSKIHVPYMIDELTVTGIEMGRDLPVIRQISRPYIDDMGLWVDCEVAYGGGFQMSLETKVNLMKLKKNGSNGGEKIASEKRSPVTDSAEEDSAESSTDEEADEPVPDSVDERPESGKSASKKLLRFVDKITQSKYFQQATEYKYIKRAMEEVSNTPLQLTVELKSLVGTLAINIPPPPTDRLWYGFRTNPKVTLQAKPKVGQKEVTITHITDWIEKKLQIEFQRVFVMPNMDDLPVPIMSDHLNAHTNDAPS